MERKKVEIEIRYLHLILKQIFNDYVPRRSNFLAVLVDNLSQLVQLTSAP